MNTRTPFGNPDGSRSDIQEVVESFVDFGRHHLGFPGDDLSVRIVVGAKGSGKTVYLRRLRAAAGANESVFAGAVQQDLPVTSNVVKFCQCFKKRDLTEKWMQLWYAAILRSLVSHFLHARTLSVHLSPEDRDELAGYPPEIVPRFRREVSVYSQVTDIINKHHTDHAFSQYFDDPAWAELASTLGDILTSMPPIYFFVDSVDEEYANAPMFWLQCQKGLFFRTMRFLRDQHFGGRLHVVACVRDHVLASVLRGEHQNRYRGEPHIISLEWDYAATEYFLKQKISRLDPRFLMRPEDENRTVGAWLGVDEIENLGRGLTEPITGYLLRHTRLLPRDIVILGNILCQEILVARHRGDACLSPQVIRRCVREAAKTFGHEQLAICANHIASSGMPSDAVRLEYDEIYTGDSEYSRGVADKLAELVQMIGRDRFGAEELEIAADHAAEVFGAGSDALAVLWQNRLLGYTEETPDGRVEVFFSERSADHFNLPRNKAEYCFHSSLIDRIGIQAVGDPVSQAPPRREEASSHVASLAQVRAQPETAAIDPNKAPERIGEYPVVGVIGRGGVGIVYQATDTRLKRPVAIKLLAGRFAEDPQGVARLQREAQLLAALDHPNIATIYSAGEHGRQPFLAMEFVAGKTLQRKLAAGGFEIPEALEVARQIALAMDAAHKKGVVHRDLKPANVMLTDEGRVKVLDFGLAKAVWSDGRPPSTGHGQTTSPEMILGTPGYMSPEQIRGGPIDERTDLWSFGCTFFECLAGRPAFRGKGPTELLTATLEEEPDWDALPKRTPRRVRKLLRQCLRKNLERRLARAAPVLEVLAAGSA